METAIRPSSDPTLADQCHSCISAYVDPTIPPSEGIKLESHQKLRIPHTTIASDEKTLRNNPGRTILTNGFRSGYRRS